MKYSFLDLSKEVLEKSEKPLTVHEIWQIAEEMELINKVGTLGKTPEKTLSARLYVDIRDNGKSVFYQSSKRPAKFYLKEKKDNIKDTDKTVIKVDKTTFSERDLHILCLHSFR